MLNKFKKNNYKDIKTLGAAFVLLLSVILINACSDAASERTEEVGGVTAQQVIDNPETYDGKTVKVSGDVEEVFEPRAFNIDSGTSVGELLVIGRTPFPKVSDRAIASGDIATITGTVRILKSVADIEKEIGWDLNPNIEKTYNMKPVLIANDSSFRAGTVDTKTDDVDTAKTVDSDNDAADDTADTTRDRPTVRQPAKESEVVKFSDYERAVDRKTYVGKRVRLEAVPVESVAGDRTFFVGTSPTKRILVVFEEEPPENVTRKGFDGNIDVDKGQKVTIDGIVMEMPPVEEAKVRFGKLMTAETLASLRNETTYIYTDDPKIVAGN